MLIKAETNTSYYNVTLLEKFHPSLPESGPLPSAFYRALGKKTFVYRVQDTRHRNTLGKDMFVEWQSLDKGGARQKAVSDRLKLAAVSLCRGSRTGTRQRGFFAVC
jgi:hypothetical protein